ncbi:phage tail sheath subtilisin-like domain-containing protein [Nocardia sp. CDC159]|uniref:Phage tail sheath subtilisin-like domain-containing protein n=1 Tax=Nocardia pulmonis TaxID=2951408 RepID=A0A9X2EA97_9NOCA|nr:MULTISPECIES: phage tail sheath C-terminal domain-containing protein [Nocardia]MCM6776644.1 phage tail sheath subtilisin-like domain-containing protein [Nocardia pulmonis]MCM6789207.1 phage tail sheath subtilisin-like domain-containing protein [Nocardia sp. CDC159]
MPVSPTYPGVYIDELPSAVRTIVGVPTSIAAFVGWAPRGPADPVHITNFDDYTQTFGGLHEQSPMSHAVYQFYLNGGSEAEIVRLVGASAAATIQLLPAPAGNPPAGGGPKLKAASGGSWGNKLRVRVDYDTKDPSDTKLYNLTIRDAGIGAQETYLNVSIDQSNPRYLANVLSGSRLVVLDGDATTRPNAHAAVTAGLDPFADGKVGDPPGGWYSEPPAGSGTDSAAMAQADYVGDNSTTGLYQLRKTDIFNMLCLPGLLGVAEGTAGANTVQDAALQLCVERRAMLIVDPPDEWKTVNDAADPNRAHHLKGDSTKNAAIYFPNVRVGNPLHGGAVEKFPPCGVVAGIWARTDVQRGVWKAPAGTAASLNGVAALGHDVPLKITDLQNGILNPLGINCLRSFPVVGPVSWGARTMRGADRLADQWKYLPVRRLALFIEESLYRGTQWVVFEPNDEPLWSSIRLNVGAFMNNLFRQGAFQGRTPQQAYLVKCDSTNNPQNDIDRGIVNILIGFAPLKPAEFVIIHIQQLAGQIQV